MHARTNQQNPELGCLDLLAPGNSLALLTGETFLQLPGIFFGPCSSQTEPSQLGQRQRLVVILSRCYHRRRTRLRIGWGLGYGRKCRKRRTKLILCRVPKSRLPVRDSDRVQIGVRVLGGEVERSILLDDNRTSQSL